MESNKTNDNNKNDPRQVLGEPPDDSKAVNPPQKPINIFGLQPDGTIVEDAEDETTQESIANSLRDIANSLHGIDESLNAQPDYSDQLNRVIELWEETNRLLRDIKESHEATADRNRPPLPPMPVGRGSSKPRTTEIDESPGVKRLRESEKGGG